MADINDAIKAAQAAAAAIVDAEVVQETLPATYDAPAEVVNYSKPSMATRGGFKGLSGIVDHFLKVDEFGLSFDSDRKKYESVLVEIDMTEEKGFWVKEQIKWGNSPVNYAARYNGPIADNGEPWGEVVARAKRVDPKAKVFDSADIVLTVLEEIPQGSKDKPAPTITVGSKVGLGLSMSNWRNWETFYHEVAAAGNLDKKIKVRLTAEEVTGKKNGLTWGVIGFALAA